MESLEQVKPRIDDLILFSVINCGDENVFLLH